MSKLSSVFAAVLAAVFSLSSITVRAANEADEPGDASSAQQLDAAAPAPWPVQVVDAGWTFLIYQPQVDKWENNRLEGRSAVSMHDDAGKQKFGVVYFSARTETDFASRMVTISDPEVSKADFPALAAGTDDYLSILRGQFAGRSWKIEQDRLLSDMEIDRFAQQSAKQPLKNDPPRILYSDRPAVLVPVDGNPVLRPVGETGLSRVMNTHALLLQDRSTSRYYLFLSDRWMAAPSLTGPWSAAEPTPQLDQAKRLAMQLDDVDLLEAVSADAAAPTGPLSIFVSTTPAELLQTDGSPQYAPIERTRLLYVTNSPDKLFLDLRTQNHYALISGRWYRTTALAQGRWNYVAPSDLPADFAMIPPDHPTQSVRAAVPGTPQAREAVIASTVPQMATVSRGAGHLEINYDGSPEFQPIEGTGLQNAVNSSVPVIRVGDNAFYALDNGVWFAAASPFGPWVVTSTVPSVIYSIPRSSPLYYVTYVRVYDSTPDVVYVGYTPGYVGSYVSNDDVVVYGTGWPYRPWIGNVWYGAPVTWGFGFSFFSSWWNPYPWHYWHRSAWASPRPFFHPWWGPWRAQAYGHGRAGFVAGGINAFHAPGPGFHNVGRIYDRWDHRSVVWNGSRAIANQQRPGVPTYSRPAPGNRFASGSDNRWHLPQVMNQDGHGRVQSPAFAGNERRQMDNRTFAPRERVSDLRQGNDIAARMRPDGRAVFDRARVNAPPIQSAQRMPAVAGVPIERSPSQPQRAMPQRNYSASQDRIERSRNNTVRIDRPVAANPGRGMQRSAALPQSRGGHSNSEGGGGHRGGDGHH